MNDTLKETRERLLPVMVETLAERLDDMASDWAMARVDRAAADRLCGTLHRIRGEASLLELDWVAAIAAVMERSAERARSGTPAFGGGEDAAFAGNLERLRAWTRNPAASPAMPKAAAPPPVPGEASAGGAEAEGEGEGDSAAPAGERGERRHSRSAVALRVDYDDAEQLVSDYITDLGEGGLFLCTAVPFEIGQEISFSISLPRVLEPIHLRGLVRWRRSRTEAPDRLPGVGVEFLFDSAGYRDEVTRLLARLRHQLEEPPAAGAPFRVLLVEDNPFAHKLFEHAVRRFHRAGDGSAPLDVISAKDGGEALELLATRDVDLAIVDYFLPVMPGNEVVRRMRRDARHTDTPILVISVGGAGVREEALAAGADLYLDKPVLLKQLLNTLRLLVQHRAAPAAAGARR